MENNFTIIFNNNKYEVNKELLFYYSPELKNKIESQNSNSIDLSDSSFLDSSFASLIDACKSRPYSINTSNFHDFCNLSFIYKVQHLIEECDEFQKHSQFVDLLIPHLFSKIRKHKDPQTLIKQIATHFIELQQRKDILTIPHEYLEQIITTSLNYKTDQSLIFKFLITKYEENEKITIFYQENNQGYVKNFEFLLKQVTSELYMFADQDDFWLPEKIEKSVEKLQKENLDLVFGDLEVVNENLKTIYPSFSKFMLLDRKIKRELKFK